VSMSGKIEYVEVITSVERRRRWSTRDTGNHFDSRERVGHRRIPRLILGPPAIAGVRSKRSAVHHSPPDRFPHYPTRPPGRNAGRRFHNRP
jgi:hypothetical protein